MNSRSNTILDKAKSKLSGWQQQLRITSANARDRFLRCHEISVAGLTPFDVIHENGLVSLRHYRPLQDEAITIDGTNIPVSAQKQRIPLVIVPPLAINMLIYDLFPERSLVKYLLAKGFDVYLIDWGVPGFRQTRFNFQTYVMELMPECLAQVRAHSGQQDISLHGWSIGGILSLLYAGLGIDSHIRNLIILGAPVDAHSSGQLGKFYQAVSRSAEWVRENTGFRLHNLNPRFLHAPGWVNTLSFKMTNPAGSVAGYLDLFKNLHDREFVVEHATNASFLDYMVAYPGGIIQDMIVRIWIDNDMADGLISIGEHSVDLKNIKANLLSFAGKSDTMVTRDAMSPLVNLVGSSDREFHVVPGGHMGILSGSKSADTIWKITADWLALRSS